MVVDDFDLIGTGVGPPEANPILVVDPNTERSGAVTGQCFQSIAGRNAQLFQRGHRVELIEFAGGDLPYRPRAGLTGRLAVPAVENVLGAGISEGDDMRDSMVIMLWQYTATAVFARAY